MELNDNDLMPRKYSYDKSGNYYVWKSLKHLNKALETYRAFLKIEHVSMANGKTKPVLKVRWGTETPGFLGFALMSNIFVPVEDYIVDGKVRTDNSQKMEYLLVESSDPDYEQLKNVTDTMEDFDQFKKFVNVQLDVLRSQKFSSEEVSIHDPKVIKFTKPKNSEKVGNQIQYTAPIDIKKYVGDKGTPIIVVDNIWDVNLMGNKGKLIGFTPRLLRTKYLATDDYEELLVKKESDRKYNENVTKESRKRAHDELVSAAAAKVGVKIGK